WIFLVSLVVYLFLYLAYPNSIMTLKYSRDFMIVNMGIYFASLLVIPWTGNRNYCRYFCPWGSLYGLIGKLGFFKITANTEECIDCDICEDNCDMGIPIRSLIHEHGEINVADCVGCGRCVQECPAGVLKLVDVRDAVRSMVTIFKPV
ncbi:MAG: 4Fe-4S binding protein, partial [Anaerolineales bacterium]|nr:4Fe-4S binding protein [Anaerolineales bacterium]